MNLVRIAKGRWEVLAEVESGGSCPVLDLLNQVKEPRRFLSRFLRVYLPLEGPPVSSLPRCRPLADGIFELLPAPGGQEPAVLFFADEDHRIVCGSTLSSRPRYFAAKSARGLQISEEAS
jgi:hypothetical protein